MHTFSISNPSTSYNLSQWESWLRPNSNQVSVSYLIPVNLALIMFAVFYESLISLKLMHDKSNLLLVAICVSKACIFAYSIMQYTSMHENVVLIQEARDSLNQPLVDLSRDLWKEIHPTEVMVPIVVGIATAIVCPVAYRLHTEYSWAIYQCVQGDPKIRSRYRGYEVRSPPVDASKSFNFGESKLMAPGLPCLDHIRPLFPHRLHRPVQSGRRSLHRARILIDNGSHSDRSDNHGPECVLCSM